MTFGCNLLAGPGLHEVLHIQITPGTMKQRLSGARAVLRADCSSLLGVIHLPCPYTVFGIDYLHHCKTLPYIAYTMLIGLLLCLQHALPGTAVTMTVDQHRQTTAVLLSNSRVMTVEHTNSW